MFFKYLNVGSTEYYKTLTKNIIQKTSLEKVLKTFLYYLHFMLKNAF